MNDAARLASEDPASGRTFGFLVQDVARLLKRHFERRARQSGLPITRRQATVMIYISRHEGVSQAEVAAWLNIEPIALVRMLDKLCEEGLVARRAHPTDRRVRTLWLTEAAQPVLEVIFQINQAIRAESFVGMPPSSRDVLIEALAQIKDNLASVVVVDEATTAELVAGADAG
ncbi:MAG TPA: MarR family transcriptional regulator [Acetobacteraceae bacterium]|jgi:DNA-binding MarR family transcriptional regulator